ncbi:MAG TPA: tetratricopeptide repeat protein, partial [Verrucomicrobiae bacterium]
PHYMAPEQVETPQEVDHRADIYSLGVVFYEMLTGELPLGKFDPPSHKVQIDVRLDDVVMRSLSKNPERRYQHVSEVRTEVETIAQNPSSPGAQASASAFAEQAAARDYQLNIGHCLRRGWNLVKQNFWPLFGVNALVVILLAFMGSFSLTLSSSWPGAHFGSILSLLLSGPMLGGLYLYFLKLMRGERPTLETVFSGFSTCFLPLFVGNLVMTLLVGLGFVCLILPGIYLSTAWLFSLVLIIDKRMEFWPAMELSRKVITKHWWKFLGFAIVLFLLKLTGIIMCIIGFFIAGPIVYAAFLYAYEDILGANAPAKGGVTPPLSSQTPAGSRGAGWGVALGVGAIIMVAFLGLVAVVGVVKKTKHRARSQGHRVEEAQHQREVEAQQADRAKSAAESADVGWHLWRNGHFDVAADMFQRSVNFDPYNTNAWNGLGWAKFNSGKTVEALNAFQKALALDSNYPGSLNGLGQIYLSQEKYDDAEKYLLQAAPNAPAAWYGLARLYLLRGDFEQAEKWAQDIVDSGQADEVARQMLKAAQEKHLSDGLRMTIQPVAPSGQIEITNATASVETWAPSLAPGEKPDLRKILDDAKDLTKRGQYEQALGRYIWFHNHEPEYGDSYQNVVRITSAISDWAELGRRYPKANRALIEIRDLNVREFAQGRGYADLFTDIQAINRELQDQDATYALFQAIRKRDPQLARQCYYWVEGLLVSKGEYQWCYENMGDPQARLSQAKQSFEMQMQNQKQMAESRARSERQLAEMNRQRGWTNTPTFFTPDSAGMMARSATNSFVGAAGMLIEILVGSGHLTEAGQIRDQALAVIDDPRLKSAVSDAQEKIQKVSIDDSAQKVENALPVVVETQPLSGARDVEPGEIEIRVRFSKEMKDDVWSWSDEWKNSMPESVGAPHYLADKRTCVIKARLQPGKTYAWWLNSDEHQNFKDKTGQPSVPYLHTFHTKPTESQTKP